MTTPPSGGRNQISSLPPVWGRGVFWRKYIKVPYRGGSGVFLFFVLWKLQKNFNFMKITFDWITENQTGKGGYKRNQLKAIGVDWPPRTGWKHRAVGLEISEEQQNIFESFSSKGSSNWNITIGKNFKLSGDCVGCCEPWEICNWPCPDAI